MARIPPAEIESVIDRWGSGRVVRHAREPHDLAVGREAQVETCTALSPELPCRLSQVGWVLQVNRLGGSARVSQSVSPGLNAEA